MNEPDVPAQVMAALERARELSPSDPPPEEPQALADWWARMAAADDARSAAYERLYQWARAGELPTAVALAINAAIEHYHQESGRARRVADLYIDDPGQQAGGTGR